MDSRWVLINLTLPWLDVIKLTKLLLTGDQALKTILQDNTTQLTQYYTADPVLDLWQWPSLALTSLPNIKQLTLITVRRTSTSLDRTHPLYTSYHRAGSQVSNPYHPLYQVKLCELPVSIEQLTLKFTGLEKASWEDVKLPNLQTIELDMDVIHPVLIPSAILRKLVNYRIEVESDADLEVGRFDAVERLEIHKAADPYYPNYRRPWNPSQVTPQFKLPHLLRTDKLTHLSMKSICAVINIALLPLSLTNLELIDSIGSGSEALQLLPLNTLVLDSVTWADHPLDKSGCHTVHMITCPPTLLTLCHKVSEIRQLTNVQVRAPSTITALRCSSGLTSSVVAGDQQQPLLCLTSIHTGVIRFSGEDGEVDELIPLIQRAPNLRSLELHCDGMAFIKLVTDVIEQHCGQFDTLFVDAVIFPYHTQIHKGPKLHPIYSPAAQLVECHIPYFYHLEDVVFSCAHQKLLELSISVKMSALTQFNNTVEKFIQLKYLRIQLKDDYVTMDHSTVSAAQLRREIILAAPKSLTILHIEACRGYSKDGPSPSTLLFQFSPTIGIPTASKFIQLIGKGCSWKFDPTQVQHYPTTLEWCYPVPIPFSAVARLHNLVPASLSRSQLQLIVP